MMTSRDGRMVVKPSISIHEEKRKSRSSYDLILGDTGHKVDSNLDLFDSKTLTSSLLHQSLLTIT